MLTLLLSVGSAAAVTLDVCPSGCTYQTVQPAVDVAVSGDVIEVGAGTYGPFSILDKDGVTVRAALGATPQFVSSGNRDGVIEVRRSEAIVLGGLEVVGSNRRGITVVDAEVAMSSMTIRDSRIRFTGAGLLVWNSDVTVSDSLFHNNHTSADGRGGHIGSVLSSDVTLVDVTFTDGSSPDGGAIWASGGTVDIQGGSLSGNAAVASGGNGTAVGAGGAVFMLGGTLGVSTVAFVDNTSIAGGGHIAVRAGTDLTVTGASFDGGTGAQGGQLWLSTVDAEIDTTTFTGGVADQGGQIHAVTSTLSVTGSAFNEGSALVGGGLLADASTVTLIDVDADACEARVPTSSEGLDDAGNGGAGAFRLSDVTVSGGSWTNNTASGAGGVFWVGSGTFSASDALAMGNIADVGGAISLHNLGETTLSGLTFDSNEARDGGAVHRDGMGLVALQDCRFEGNVATGNGGALASTGVLALRVQDTRFVANVASSGGALASGPGSTVEATRSVWCSNTATGDGGAFWQDGGRLDASFDNAVWVGNIAGRGGAVWLSGANGQALFDHNTFVGNDATEGAAVYGAGHTVSIQQSIVASQVAGPAVRTATPDEAVLDYIAWWDNLAGDVGGGLDPNDIGSTHLYSDPLFQDLVPSGDCDDTVWVAYDSPTVDAGNPADSDPASSVPSAQMPADIGALGGTEADPLAWTDGDGDGWPLMWDCDDSSALVYPEAPEQCDGIDNNCNGLVDDDAVGEGTYYLDADSDGWGSDEQPVTSCSPPDDTYVLQGGDCDDDEPLVFPDADEVCNGVDDDCNDAIDDAPSDGTLVYRDVDGDDFGVENETQRVCGEPEEGWTLVPGDCDDSSDATYPFAPELCDGVSNDCDDEVDEDPVDGTEYLVDFDGDGFGGVDSVVACTPPDEVAEVGGDCDDADVLVFPGATEQCNGVDDDCDGVVDPPGSIGSVTVFTDADDDGYGDPETETSVCTPADDQVLQAGDCDDAQVTVHDGADEVCDGMDNDCDGETDEDVVGLATWYQDADLDGFGSGIAEPIESCEQPDGYVSNARDCDDADQQTNPDAVERCNGRDDDCDESVDEEALDAVLVYVDEDGDGQGAEGTNGELVCDPGERATTATDCDDTDPTVFEGAEEVCDGLDNDCDGERDEDIRFEQWYADLDGDGFGGDALGAPDCAPPEDGAVREGGDCDDTNADVFPGAEEVVGDGIDQDCDGLDTLPDPVSSREWEAPEDTGVSATVGCDCQTGSAPSGAMWWSLGLGLLLVGRRRNGGK